MRRAARPLPVNLIRVDGDGFLDQEVDVLGHFASFFSVEAWRLSVVAGAGLTHRAWELRACVLVQTNKSG